MIGGDIITITSGIMSSNSDEWETPADVFNHYNKIFCFTCDVCASKNNAKVDNFFDVSSDGLKQSWCDRNWMNPPYGRKIGKWVKKAYKESQNGKLVVCLLPARTDTRWWHDYVVNADSIHFIKGRLKFGDGVGSAPFPSVIVIYGLNYHK